MKKTLCWKTYELEYPIKLYQTGKDSFTVVYGQQSGNGLNRDQAAMELGTAIMHALRL